MAKKSSGHALLKGAVLGIAFGVAAGLLATSDAGKKVGKDIHKKASQFYTHLIPQLKRMKRVGEKEYKMLALSVMKRYAKSKKISQKEADAILKKAHATWKEIKKHI